MSRRRLRVPRPASRLPLLLAGLTLGATALPAQTRVRLELRPVVGDTIRMRIEQETEVVGERTGGSTLPAPRTVSMSLRLWSRAIVQGRTADATDVLTVTDSVRLATTDPHARELAARTERALAGRAVRLRLAPDGTARVEGRQPDGELSAVVAAMPAALPASPVGVGDRWRREMPVPGVDGLGAEEGIIRAVFRLDSLSRDARWAWISVKGELSRDPLPAFGGYASAADMRGTLHGWIVLDRRRGWLEDAHFAILVRTTVAPPRGSAAPVMRIQTRIEQRMRAESARGDTRGARP